MKHRVCRALLCLVLAVSLLLPMTVGALAGSTTIGTDASRPEYFEALGASGNYNPLKTPYHYDKTTGNVAYCLEHRKDSPSSSAEYTDFDASALWGQNTVTGIQAIVDHGYPNSCGGLSEEQAHYATANAIRAWMKESADVGYEFMRVDKGHVRPLSGTAAQQTWDFFLELLGYARAGDVLSGGGGTVRVSPREAVWTVDGDVLRTRIEVVSSDGYALSRSHSQVSVSGYTGGTYDVLDVTAPASLLGQTVQLYFEADAGAGNGVTLYWYEPASASSQSVAVVQLGGGSGVGEMRTVTITGPQLVSLTVNKRDGSTGEALDGAVFALADAAGNPVGLTQTGAGRYTAGGSAAQFTTSGGTAVIEGLMAGSYTLTEVSPPSPGYAAIAPETLQLTASGTVTIDNVPTEINVTKQDGLTGERLAGMQFSLLDGNGERVTLTRGADGVYRPDAQGGAYFVTDENGQARILGLPQGSYAIAESAHEGYAELDESPRFELTVRADVTITNEPLTLEITKTDGYTGEGMSGVGFVLVDEQGASVTLRKTADGVYVFDRAAQGDALVTGADGKAMVYYLPVGVYMLEEETQDGYVQTEPVQVTVAAGNGLSEPARAQVKNDPTVLILTKSDAATREPLDGATFRLVDETGAVIKLSKTGEGNYRPSPDGQETFTTEKGEVCIRYLPSGSYTVEEVSAPDGYTADAPKTATVTDASDDDHPVRVNMQDMPLAMEFRKVDAESGAALDGCVFSLKDADGNVLKLRKASDGVYVPDTSGNTTYTTVDGKAVVVQINPGTYRVEEVTAAEGYALAEDVAVTVTDASTSAAPATVTMQDEMLALRITKVDADTRQTLGGAVFNVKGESGELLRFAPVLGKADTFEVVANGSENLTIPKSGSVTFLKVPVGVYEIDRALTDSCRTFAGGAEGIVPFLAEHDSQEERVRFIRERYGIGGMTIGNRLYEDHNGKGIEITLGSLLEPEDQVLLPWRAVAERLAQIYQREILEAMLPDETEALGLNVEPATYHISESQQDVPRGPKARFQGNLDAIRMLKAVEAEGRYATPEEQEVLAQYVGWGGLADAFDPNKESWKEEYAALKGVLTDAEYAAARASTLTAFYTPPVVIQAMYAALGNMGFSGGNLLEIIIPSLIQEIGKIKKCAVAV